MRLPAARIRKIRKLVRRILVIYWGTYGDVLTTTPLLGALKKHFKRPYIAYILGRGADRTQNASRLIENDPNVDKFINAGASILSDVLREKPFDMVIDLVDNRTSRLVSKLSGAKIKLWGGYREIPDHFLYSDSLDGSWTAPKRIGVDKFAYRAGTNLKFAELFGYRAGEAIEPRIHFTGEERERSRKRLDRFKESAKDTVVAIQPGGRNADRLWKTANYSVLADRIIDRYGAKVLIFHGPKEKHFAESVRKSAKNKLSVIYENDVRRYASLIAGCDAFISTDGGPLQMALASGVSSVGIFKRRAVKNAAHWYDHKARKGLFHTFVRAAKHPTRYIKAKSVGKGDMREIESVVKRVAGALKVKDI